MNRLLLIILILVESILFILCESEEIREINKFPWWITEDNGQLMKECVKKLNFKNYHNVTEDERNCIHACVLKERKFMKDHKIDIEKLIEDSKIQEKEMKKNWENFKININSTDEQNHEHDMDQFEKLRNKMEENKKKCAKKIGTDQDECKLAGKFVNCIMGKHSLFSGEERKILQKCGEKLSIEPKNALKFNEEVKYQFEACIFVEKGYIIDNTINAESIINDLDELYDRESNEFDEDKKKKFQQLVDKIKKCASDIGKNSDLVQLLKQFTKCADIEKEKKNF